MSDFNPRWNKDDDRPIDWADIVKQLAIAAAFISGAATLAWLVVFKW